MCFRGSAEYGQRPYFDHFFLLGPFPYASVPFCMFKEIKSNPFWTMQFIKQPLQELE